MEGGGKVFKEYVGSCYEILETSEKIYIRNDFPNEYSHSKDTKLLKGTNAKAKANAFQVIEGPVRIASGKSVSQHYGESMVIKPKRDGIGMILDLHSPFTMKRIH